MISTSPTNSCLVLSSMEPKSAAWHPVGTSPDSVPNHSIIELSDPLGMSSETKTSILTSTSSSRLPAYRSHHQESWESLSLRQDLGNHHLEETPSLSSIPFNKNLCSPTRADSPSKVRRPSTSADPASSKRKSPKIFTQLARELRWIHNNLSHRYEHGATARVKSPADTLPTLSSRLSAPTSTLSDDDQSEDLIITTSLRSSIRRSSPAREAASNTSNDDSPRYHRPGNKSGSQPMWHVLEKEEGVKRTQPAALLEVVPDPYAPRSCQYVLHNLPAVFGETHWASSPGVLCRKESKVEAGCGFASFFQASPFCAKDGEPADASKCQQRPPNEAELTRYETGEGEKTVGAVEASIAYQQGQVSCTHSSASGVPRGMEADTATAMSDAYEIFLGNVAALHLQLHNLERHTAALQAVYEEEQRARLRSRAKGQRLSWTRTVEAANTIHFWRQKAITLRLFESHYLTMLNILQKDLQLVDPKAEILQQHSCSLADPDIYPGSITAVREARRAFLSSAQVLVAQEEHLRELGDKMKASWEANAVLREKLHQLEHSEVRVPHITFSTAGMDVEHFIASLPPRASISGMNRISSQTPTHSSDSMDGSETPMLLTAQNISFASNASSDGDGNTGSRATNSSKEAINKCAGSNDYTAHPLACTSPSSATPLVSCIKHAIIGTSTPSTPITSKKLKYVIFSATLEPKKDSTGRLNGNITSPIISSSMLPTYSQRVIKRHVTFALKPEVLDTRPRFCAHSRTVELLEHICLDKQTQWTALPLLNFHLEEFRRQLLQLRLGQSEAQTEEVLTHMPHVQLGIPTEVTSSSSTKSNQHTEGTTEPRQGQLSCAPSSIRTPTTATETRRNRNTKKVRSKVCVPCTVM